METYPLDIAPEHVLAWLMDEQRRAPGTLLLRATRSYIAEEIPQVQQKRMGEEEKEELTHVTKIGLLEVSDPHAQIGWVLRIRIEDSLSDRLPEDEPVPEGEEEIDLAAFNTEFVVPGSGTAFINVDAQSSEAWKKFQSLLDAMSTNRHVK
jgi:hypothetical protein